MIAVSPFQRSCDHALGEGRGRDCKQRQRASINYYRNTKRCLNLVYEENASIFGGPRANWDFYLNWGGSGYDTAHRKLGLLTPRLHLWTHGTVFFLVFFADIFWGRHAGSDMRNGYMYILVSRATRVLKFVSPTTRPKETEDLGTRMAICTGLCLKWIPQNKISLLYIGTD